MGVALAPLAGFLIPTHTEDAVANGDTRTITLYHVHTRETTTATFRVDGRYDPAALEKLNWALRDWRRDEPTKIDPRLFDVAWEVHREVGSSRPIQIMSAFRSPETNAMLRRRSRAVAEYSQHMLGKAMDVHLMDVPMSRVREVAMRLQRGGVGYYPTSGTPFVHMDVGSVRYWPRMSRQELARIFPDGKTVDIPADGQPMPRYQEALAEIQARGGSAYYATTESSGKSKSLLAMLFGGDEEDGSRAAAPAAAAPAVAPTPRESRVVTVASPTPAAAESDAGQPALTAMAYAPAERERIVDIPIPVAKPRVLAENDVVTGKDAGRADPNGAAVPLPPPRPTEADQPTAAAPALADVPVPPMRPAEFAIKNASRQVTDTDAAASAHAASAKSDPEKEKSDARKAVAAVDQAELRVATDATSKSTSATTGAKWTSANSTSIPKSDGKLNVVAIPPSSRLAARLPSVITQGIGKPTAQPSALAFAETPATRGLQQPVASTAPVTASPKRPVALRRASFVAARIDRSNFRTLTASAPTERATSYTAQGVGSAVAPMRAAAQTQQTTVTAQRSEVVAVFGARAPYGDLKPGMFSGPAVKAFSMVEGFEALGNGQAN